MQSPFTISQRLAVLLLPLGVLFSTIASPVQAAEQITFIVGPLNRSITLNQLRDLVETGDASGDLKTILKVAGQSPETAGQFLSRSIPFDLVTAYRLLTSTPGEVLLDKLGTVLAPRRSNDAGAEALRSAILLSLSDDNQLSILELLEKYPTDARVNVDALQSIGDEFGDVTNLLGAFSGN
jgi:hypothetical protein